MLSRAEALTLVLAALEPLALEELLVVRYLADRLAIGQRTYGQLDLIRDSLEQERAAELADALVYTGMAEVRRVLTRRSDSE